MKIKKNHLKNNSINSHLTFKERENNPKIDTLIIHSCYLSKNMLNPLNFEIHENHGIKNYDIKNYDIKNYDIKNYDNALKELFSELNNNEHCENDLNLIIEEIDSIIGIKLKNTFKSLNVNNKFSIKGIKAVFELLGVSAHYVIDRNGTIHEMVDPEFMAFHAGKSCLPNSNRDKVNNFSIGVELLASSEDKVTNQQYRNLSKLINKLRINYPISNFYGHNDIALPKGRKIDPEGFNWNKFINISEIYKIPNCYFK